MNPELLEPPMPVEHVHCAGADIFAEVRGKGRPILLLHGWTLDHRSFYLQVSSLSKHMRVINIDRRGTGRSTGESDLGAELDDIDRIIDQLAGEPVHLLGVSQGGRLALHFAARRPERLRSLILQGAVLDGFKAQGEAEQEIPLAKYAELVRAGRMSQMRAQWLEHPMMSSGVTDLQQRELLRKMLQDYSGRDLLGTRAAEDTDLTGSLRKSTLKTLIITGELEVEVRKQHANRLLDVLPNAIQIFIDGAGHLSNLSHADIYNHLVADFCRAVDN